MISGTVDDSNGMEPLPLSDLGASSVNLKKSSGGMQLQSFNFQHGLLILHTLAVLIFVPSLFAWSQRISTYRSFPKFVDSALCAGAISPGLLGLATRFFVSSIFTPWRLWATYWPYLHLPALCLPLLSIGSSLSSLQSILCYGSHRWNFIRFKNYEDWKWRKRKCLLTESRFISPC